MAWSTSELARLAQTTTSTIRHYHRLGLLEDPERRPNGYKQYSAVHLVRLLQIRRLADRGIRLTAIGRILRDDADSAAALEQVDSELKASMRELARARRDLAAIREHRARADTPRGFEELSTGLSERQRSLLTLFATVMSPAILEEFRQSLIVGSEVDEDFENLPADADDAAVEAVAQRMVPTIAAARTERPRLEHPEESSPLGESQALMVLGHAIAELYNPAQLRALLRANQLLDS